MGLRHVDFKRILKLPRRSFFLFGPRGVGKSTWLRQVLPANTIFFDLLSNATYLELSRTPEILENLLEGVKEQERWVCIDEIQRVPELLNEVHRLIENKKIKFALSGSSARKLKRGGANLLAGRAVTRSLESFSAEELEEKFNLKKALEWGTLPLVYLNPNDAADILESYVATYIREEIKEEGLVRKVEPFLRFLEVAGLLNGQQLNLNNIAREVGVPRNTVETYFSILEDTLVAFRLPAYRPGVKVRERSHPKFYWFDPGVARGAAGLLRDPLNPLWLGNALETYLYHELRVYNQTHEKHRKIAYYRTPAGSEIDFIIETKKRSLNTPAHVIALEIKSSKKWDRKWEKALHEFTQSKSLKVKGIYGVYLGEKVYNFGDIKILPAEEFLKRLYRGDIF